MIRLLVLTPSLGRVSLGYCETFARLTLECARRNVHLTMVPETDPGQLVHARNVLFAAAIESDATHAFWWDADVSFDAGALFDLLERPEPMIVAPYLMRATDWQQVSEALIETLPRIPSADELRSSGDRWTVQIEFQNGKPMWSDDRRLLRITSCGFGWVLMKVEAMRLFHLARFGPGNLPIDWMGRRCARHFDLVQPQAVIHGEDTSFCVRWRSTIAEPGFSPELWATPDLVISNGDRRARFADYLKRHELA